MRRSVPLRERFTKFVRKAGDDECWTWLGSRDKAGYGKIGAGGGIKIPALAHRVAYELANGPIPQGAHILHSCDNKGCVNPKHLSAGTNRQNIYDAFERGLFSKRKLTAEQVLEIRNSSTRIVDVCSEFGISRSYVARLRAGTKGNAILRQLDPRGI